MDYGENNKDFGADQIHNWNLTLRFCSSELGEANLEFSFPLSKETMGVENGRGTYPSFTGSLVLGLCTKLLQDEMGAGDWGSLARACVKPWV